MICNIPEWLNKVFDFYLDGKITEQTLYDATAWLINKAIITCNETV